MLSRSLVYCALLTRPVELVVSTDWLLIAQLLYCIVIAVQKGIIAAVYCVCEMVAFPEASAPLQKGTTTASLTLLHVYVKW